MTTVTFSGGQMTAIKRGPKLYLDQTEVVAALYKMADEAEPNSHNAAIALRAAARLIAQVS